MILTENPIFQAEISFACHLPTYGMDAVIQSHYSLL